MTPRGIRNNNPGNIRKGAPWQGLAAVQSDPVFCVFEASKWGIRAIARMLITYHDQRRAKNGTPVDTVQEILERWAPPAENDTDAYVADVCGAMAVAPDAVLDLHRYDIMRPLVEAIIQHENGCQPYTRSEIDRGLGLAGVDPGPRSNLRQSRTVKGGQLAGAGGAAATIAGIAGQLSPALPVLNWIRDNLAVALIALGVAVLAGVGYMLWARIDDRNKGLR